MDPSLVRVRLLLEGGHSQILELDAQAHAPELERMYRALSLRDTGSAQPHEQFFQLPLDSGKGCFSFSAAQLVAVSTEPPIVIRFENQVASPPSVEMQGAVESPQLHRPAHVIIDDFLGVYESADMLAYARQHESGFAAGTVSRGLQTQRQNLSILDFAQQPHSKLVCNRLLTWFPSIVQNLGMDLFPIHQVESQLTASNDGHFYRSHVDRDAASEIERVLTCVYYFSKQPVPFSGGALRLYDTVTANGQSMQAGSFQQIEPVPNRMVVFPSESYHELLPIRCPGKRFEDSRFAVTNWVWASSATDPEVRHGWGHMRCGRVPENWLASGENA